MLRNWFKNDRTQFAHNNETPTLQVFSTIICYFDYRISSELLNAKRIQDGFLTHKNLIKIKFKLNYEQ